MTAHRHALSGVRVLDFTHFLAGPFCTRLLVDLGADIVKVESRVRPDRMGARLPRDDYRGRRDRTAPYLSFNRNKRSIAINLKSESGRELAKRLAGAADVIVENFSTGVMARLGLDYAALGAVNPRLIYISMSGYGQTGPRRDELSMNMNLQAHSGLMMVNGLEGQPPMSIANSWNDFVGGFNGALAIVHALSERRASGRGTCIDLSQFECSVATLGPLVLASAANKVAPKRIGNRAAGAAPQGVYRCMGKDEWCSITVNDNAQWRSLVRVAELSGYEEDAELARFVGRMRRHDEIDGRIASFTASKTALDVEAILRGAGVPARRMRRGDDLAKSVENGPFTRLDDPAGCPTVVAGASFHLAEPAPVPHPAPRLGEHSTQVLLEWLGMSEGEAAAQATESPAETT